MKKLVIFDMDGLILDSETGHDWSWVKTFERMNLDISQEDRHSFVGLNYSSFLKQIKKVIGEENSVEDTLAIKNEIYKSRYHNHIPDIKQGVIELIKELKNRGLKIAIATSTGTEKGTKILKTLELYDHFDFHAFGDMVKETKPNPAIYNKVVDYFGFDKRDILVLEDSYPGIKAANNAGIDVIWIKDFIDHSHRNDIQYIHAFDSLVEAHETIKQIVLGSSLS